MFKNILWVTVAVAATTPLGAGGQETPITMVEARQEARRQSLDVLAVQARARAATDAASASGGFLWPSIQLEADAVRLNDPVGVFGGKLRQGRFTEADFALSALNDPDPLADWSGAATVAWAPLNPSALAARGAAQLDADAARSAAAWSARAAEFRVEVRYLETVAAGHRTRSAEAAFEAAAANLAAVTRRREEGLLTDADVLQAQAALEDARARSLDAGRELADARGRLALALGWSDGRDPVPTDTIFADLVSVSPESGWERREDLVASALGVRSAERRVSEARRARLPMVQAFARIARHSNGAFDSGASNWSLGVSVRVPVFQGFSLGARERAASANAQAASLDHERRLMEASTEVSAARRAVETAAAALAAAHAASDAASEASRLMRRRFEEGLTTTADLLDAEARSAALRVSAVDTEFRLRVAHARLALLTDTNSPTDTGNDR